MGTYEAGLLNIIQMIIISLFRSTASIITTVILVSNPEDKFNYLHIYKFILVIISSFSCWQTALFLQVFRQCNFVFESPVKSIEILALRIEKQQFKGYEKALEAMLCTAKFIESKREDKITAVFKARKNEFPDKHERQDDTVGLTNKN